MSRVTVAELEVIKRRNTQFLAKIDMDEAGLAARAKANPVSPEARAWNMRIAEKAFDNLIEKGISVE
jgi:hypothetical protein